MADDAIGLAEMASGTDGNIISYDASGNPVAIATGSDGQVLTSTGAGSPPAFEAVPAGGITQTDQWRLTTNFSGNVNPIENNLERDDTSGFGKMGSGMSVSSGVWTFPVTGLWRVEYNMNAKFNGDSREVYGYIASTNDNSTWVNRSEINFHINQTESNVTTGNGSAVAFMAVTSTTNCKVRFSAYGSNTSRECYGSSIYNRTYFTFTRIGDV